MPPVARMGDICSGHAGFPPRPCLQGSPNVLVNGIPAQTVGDAYAVHCAHHHCHMGVLAVGAPNVLVNGKPLGRVGDFVSCGSVVAVGSVNVICGG